MTTKEAGPKAPDGEAPTGAEARGADAPGAAPAQLGDDPRFRRLVALANGGDREALIELRKFLDGRPDVWRAAGDVAAVAEMAWTQLLAGGSALYMEAIKRSVAALKGALAGPAPTSLEALLIDQVAVCWLASKYAEVGAADPSERSLAQAAMRLKRVESAQRRLLAAARALATLRALLPSGLAPISAPRLHEPAGGLTA
jgi:hypothetical protein